MANQMSTLGFVSLVLRAFHESVLHNTMSMTNHRFICADVFSWLKVLS